MGGSVSGCCDKKKSMKRGPWTAQEDEKLFAYIQQHGHGSWRSLPSSAGLERCGKSCRLRWTNYLRPDIKRGNFSLHEDQTIIQLHALLGNRWSAIATYLPKRTDNEIKNYWNTRLKKRLAQMGIDPITHKPIYLSQSREMANTSHMAQWESARVQAEARLSRGLKFISNPRTAPAPPPPLPRPPCLDVLKVWEWSNPAASLTVEGFSPSSMLSVPTVGLFDGNSSFVAGNAISSQNEARGIMRLDHYQHSTDYVDQEFLRFSSFVDGFACHSSNAIEGWMMGSSGGD